MIMAAQDFTSTVIYFTIIISSYNVRKSEAVVWLEWGETQWWPSQSILNSLLIERQPFVWWMVRSRIWWGWSTIGTGLSLDAKYAKRCRVEKPSSSLFQNDLNGNVKVDCTFLLKYCKVKMKEITWIEDILRYCKQFFYSQ